MFNIISLILGIISYGITWNISSSIQNSQINSTTVSYCINLLFTISTVFVLLPFVFGNSFTHNMLNLLMIIAYLIILLVLFFSISKLPKIPDLPDYWYNTIPTILFMILMLIYTQFNITKSIGFTAILFGLYFSIFNLVYYFTSILICW